MEPVTRSVWPGGNLKLRCPSPSNLAEIIWKQNDKTLTPSTRLQLQQDGLLILNASRHEAGRYRCLIVEHSTANTYTTVGAEYKVTIDPGAGRGGSILLPQAQTNGPSVAGLQAAVALLTIFLLALLAWNFFKGHLPLPCIKKNGEESQQTPDQESPTSKVIYQDTQRSAMAENKPLVSETQNSSSNNNHTAGGGALSDSEESNGPSVNLPSMQYIDDESEI